MKHADDQIQQGDDAKLETVVQEREICFRDAG